MNWLDIVIIIGLLVALFSGLKAGLVKMLFIVVGVIIGVTLAGRYADGLGNAMGFISDHNTAATVAFVIILVATLIVALILAVIVERLVHWVLLGWLDSLGGAIFGLLLGAIFIGAILAMCYHWLGVQETIAGSALGRFLIDKFGLVLGLLPAEFQGIHSIFY